MQEHNVEVRIGFDDDGTLVDHLGLTFTAEPSEASAIRSRRVAAVASGGPI